MVGLNTCSGLLLPLPASPHERVEADPEVLLELLNFLRLQRFVLDQFVTGRVHLHLLVHVNLVLPRDFVAQKVVPRVADVVKRVPLGLHLSRRPPI